MVLADQERRDQSDASADAITAEYRRQIASLYEVLEERIHITIDATGNGKLLFHL
jgi:hypothetical protein